MNEELVNSFYSGLKIDGISVWEYYKNKPLEYEKHINIYPIQETFRINQSHINKYQDCQLADICSAGLFNPYYNPIKYLENIGYKVEEFIPGTGSSTAIISKII